MRFHRGASHKPCEPTRASSDAPHSPRLRPQHPVGAPSEHPGWCWGEGTMAETCARHCFCALGDALGSASILHPSRATSILCHGGCCAPAAGTAALHGGYWPWVGGKGWSHGTLGLAMEETSVGSPSAPSCPLHGCHGVLTALIINSLLSLGGSVIPVSLLMAEMGGAALPAARKPVLSMLRAHGAGGRDEEDPGSQDWVLLSSPQVPTSPLLSLLYIYFRMI